MHKYGYYKPAQAGFTLMELMVAITLGLIVSGAIAGVFLQSKTSFQQNNQIGFIQDTGRYALDTLAHELAMMDFFGGLLQPATTVAVAVDPDALHLSKMVNATGCTSPNNDGFGALGELFKLEERVVYRSGVSSSSASTTFPCMTDIDANTDVLMIKRVKGQMITAAANLEPNKFYIRTNRTDRSQFFLADSNGDGAVDVSDPNTAADEADFEYLMYLYYVDDGKLKRRKINTTLGHQHELVDETLAEGIERFHIEFGIDTDLDATADYFVSSPTAVEMRKAAVARVHVLVKGKNPVPRYNNTNAYTLGDVTVAAANDSYYRRVFSTSVYLRNTSAVSIFAGN